MAEKVNQIDADSNWYYSLYTSIKQTPINVSLLIVSAFIFYKVVSITRHRRNREQQRQEEISTGARSGISEESLLSPLRRDFTVGELHEFNGSREDGRILLAINFHVYDVSGAKHYYGENGIYPNYAGRDISRNLINFSVETNDRDDFDDLSDLSIDQMNTLREWDQQYKDKYPYVGRLLRDGEPHTNYADEEDDESEQEKSEDVQNTLNSI